MSPPPISREDVGRAVDAILGFLRARAKQRKAQLFEHDDFLYLHLSVRRFPSTSRVSPYLIPLPHSLYPLDPSRTSLCLIADDSLAEKARSTAAAEKLPFDSVIPLSELRTDYVPFESRRRLCDSYDIFFAERRIVTFLPRLIGNYFFKKKKIPLAVDISRIGWPEAVRQACRSTFLFFSCGTSVGVKVGRVSMDREEIIDNLMAAIEGVVDRVPKKWANVRCMYIKAVQSVALPIYQAVPELGLKIDVDLRENAESLDGLVVQERDGKSGGEKEKSRKKRMGSKKRKGRIHDVDYVGSKLVDGCEDDDGEATKEQENDVIGMEEKKKKKNKVGKGTLSKGKKSMIVGIDEDDGEEKENDYQFIELDSGRKKRKRAKKIVNSEVEEHVINDGLAVDAIVAADEDDRGHNKKFLLKKKMKSIAKKGKKVNLRGSQERREDVGADEDANVMNLDAAIATAVVDDADHVDADLSHIKKKVKNSVKIGKNTKIKKVKKTKLRQ